jgi:hypothetical protein
LSQSPVSSALSPSHFRRQHAIFSLGPYATGFHNPVVDASADDREERPCTEAPHFAAPYSSRKSGAQQLSALVSASVAPPPRHAQTSKSTNAIGLVDERIKVTMMDELDDLCDLAKLELHGSGALDVFAHGGSQARSVLAAALCEQPSSGVTPTRVSSTVRDVLHGSARDDAHGLAQVRARAPHVALHTPQS